MLDVCDESCLDFALKRGAREVFFRERHFQLFITFIILLKQFTAIFTTTLAQSSQDYYNAQKSLHL